MGAYSGEAGLQGSPQELLWEPGSWIPRWQHRQCPDRPLGELDAGQVRFFQAKGKANGMKSRQDLDHPKNS